jgi:hypothetical protein
VLLLLVTSGLGWWLYDRYFGERELRQLMAELDRTDPGWRLEEIEAARATLPDAENGALQVQLASGLLPTGWADPSPPGPGTNLQERLGKLNPEVRLGNKEIQELRAVLGKVAPALAQARQMVVFPRGRHAIGWSRDPFGIVLPSLTEVKAVALLLALDAARRAHDGDLDGALLSVGATVNVGRSIGDEPFLLSQWMRMGCQRYALRSMERVLGQGEPSGTVLQELQNLLTDEAEQPLLLMATHAERAGMHQAMLIIKAGQFSRRAYSINNPLNAPDGVMRPWDAADARAYHAVALRYLTELVEIARLPPAEQSARLERLPKPKLPYLLAQMILIHNDRVSMVRHFRSTQGLLRCAVAALAVERYRQTKHHWPDSLADLIPEFLGEVPADPFDGAPLRFRKLADGVVIYALDAYGLDLIGSDGSGKVANGNSDVAVRLWDPGHRRRPPP